MESHCFMMHGSMMGEFFLKFYIKNLQMSRFDILTMYILFYVRKMLKNCSKKPN